MGENKFKFPEDFKAEPKYPANVILYDDLNPKGITLKTGNRFFKRLWYSLTNPFRYLLTGKIYY